MPRSLRPWPVYPVGVPRRRPRTLARLSLVGVLLAGLVEVGPVGGQSPTPAPTPIEDTLLVETSVSKLVVEATLSAFAEHAKTRWGVTVRTGARYADASVSYARITGWKGRPQADIFWGGEVAPFDQLAEQQLLERHEVAPPQADAVPASLGRSRSIRLKDPGGYWIGTALEPYGLVYHPRVLHRLGVHPLTEWDDLLDPRLWGNVAQCAPTRSSASHATYEALLQLRGEVGGWQWLRRLGGQTGLFATRDRDVASVVAKGEFAAGFAVPASLAFEEAMAGFALAFVAPPGAYVSPQPIAVLTGASHPKVARAFIEFLLAEGGQTTLLERGLVPIIPGYRDRRPPGPEAEKALAFTGRVRAFVEGDAGSGYAEDVAGRRRQIVDDRFRREIEAVWEDLRARP